jgi:hypothetical protein
MSVASTVPTVSTNLSGSNGETSPMTDETGEVVVEEPSPKDEDKHPLLQKDITSAN